MMGQRHAIWLNFPLGEKRRVIILHAIIASASSGTDKFGICSWASIAAAAPPVPLERYQDGAYWATASGWVMWSLRKATARSPSACGTT
jgi:hypothetical protein